VLAVLALFVVGLPAGPVRATEPAEQLTPAEADRKKEALQHDVLEWDPAPTPRIGPGAWSMRWRDGLFLERYDGRARLHIGGRLLLDGAGFHLDEGLRGVAGQAGWDSDGEIRQGHVFAQATLLRRFFARAVYDWDDGEFLDVFFGVRGLGPLGTLQAGYMKAPFSLEERTSRLALTFMERSLANALVPGRDSGLLFTNTLLDGRLRWAAGALVVSDGFGSIDGSDLFDGLDESWSTNVRVTGLPVWSEDSERMVLLGFSYAHRFSIQQELSLTVRPESSVVPPLLDTGSIAGARSTDGAGLEAAWQHGSLSAQGELIGSWVHRNGAPDLFFWGGYVEASWLLTGEHRIYGQHSASFGRIVPNANFAPWKGRWGAFQLAARVSWLDLDDADVAGGRQLDLTLGLNWYLHTKARLMFNYVHAHVRGAGDADIAQMRIQLDY
jgi:phosphate-selective porin OprO/OprP